MGVGSFGASRAIVEAAELRVNTRRLRERWLTSGNPRTVVVLVVAVFFGYTIGAEVAWRSFAGLAFFPPAGITLAAMLYAPRRAWPALCAAIVVAEVSVDMRHGVDFAHALAYGFANAIEPVVGAMLFRRWRPRAKEFATFRDVAAFVAGPCVIAPAIGGFLIATAAADVVDGSFWSSFVQLWAGDGVAVLALSSTILLGLETRVTRHSLLELGVGLSAMTGVSIVAIQSEVPAGLLVIPALAWAVFRLGLFGVSLFGTVYAVVANYLTGAGHGVFADLDLSPDARVAVMQLEIAVLFIAGWLVGIEVRERRRFEAERIDRRHADLLRQHARRLAGAALPRDVARVTCAIVRAAFGAGQSVVVWRDPPALAALMVDGDEHHPIEHWYEDTATDEEFADAIARGALEEIRARIVAGDPDQIVAPAPQMASVLHVPVHDRSGLIGIGLPSTPEVSANDRALLEGIATQHRIALERSILHERDERRRSRAEILQQLASELAAISTPQDMAVAIARNARKMLDADYARLALVDHDHDQFVFYHGDTVSADLLEVWAPAPLSSQLPSRTVVETGKPLVFNNRAALMASYPEVSFVTPGWEFHAFATVPISVDDTAIGALSFAWDIENSVDDDALVIMTDIADNCAAALARAARTQREAIIAKREHQTASQLQRALLPDRLASVQNVQLAARYVPADENLQVGGDWFETLVLPDGRLAIAVGDIVGHGLEAAATMGRMRTAFAALAPSSSSPLDLVSRLDQFARTVPAAAASTVVCAFVDPADGAVSFATAGHPPMVVHGNGRAEVVNGGRSRPLGVLSGPRRGEGSLQLAPDATLVLYSDGLIESRREPLDVGVERLRQHVAAERSVDDVQDFCDRIVGGLVGDATPSDDVVVLTATYRPATHSLLNMTVPAVPEQLGVLRQHLRRVLAARAVPDADVGRIVLAVGEACTNVIEHGYQMSGDGDLGLSMEADENGTLVVKVRDQGRWRVAVADRNRGRGTSVMQGMSDSFERRTDANGTLVRMAFVVGARKPTNGSTIDDRG